MGSTNDLRRRMEQHRSSGTNAHTKRYQIKRWSGLNCTPIA
ncbi:MAG: hypothetical protein AAF619_14030 [Pseudomonadota bacterium]